MQHMVNITAKNAGETLCKFETVLAAIGWRVVDNTPTVFQIKNISAIGWAEDERYLTFQTNSGFFTWGHVLRQVMRKQSEMDFKHGLTVRS